jgi:hypothetical protein
MKFTQNQVKIAGYLYSFGEANGRNMLETKISGDNSKNPGTEYIAGTIQVAVDEAGLNVIPVHFTYVTEKTSTGKTSPTFGVLKNLIENGKTWVAVGKENATKIAIDTALALNDFYVNDAQRGETLISSVVHEGGFVNVINGELPPEAERNTFRCDMVITNVTHIDADGEKVMQDYSTVRGAIFNFRKEILPITFTVRNPQGMAYFEGLDTEDAPIYTKVWGNIICETKTTTITEESAFGEDAVRTFEKKTRDWCIMGTARECYEFGEEDILTGEELTKAMQDREIKLADIKKRAEEYKASKGAPTAAPAAAPKAKAGGFNF